MRILTVVGARPQFVKAAVVSHALRVTHEELLLHTGQHYDDAMSARFFRELRLPLPDIELNVGSASHAEQTARMLVGIERAIIDRSPDWVLVYGDTNSTIAAALAAAKLHVPVAHVEAGLRSFNRAMPEEINRVVTDQLSDVLFCPSQTAADNLRREGISQGVHVVGDVMAEAVSRFAPSAVEAAAFLAQLQISAGEYLLATVHRAENTNHPERLRGIVQAWAALSTPIVFPAHPRVRRALDAARLTLPPHVKVIDPVGYVEMLALVKSARAVMTDSGGLQKEAYWLGVPCITLRDESEWVETIALGWNRLVGAQTELIVDAVRDHSAPATRPQLYGEGDAVRRITDVLAARPTGAMA